MPTFSATQNLPSAAPHVFAFLADARNMPRWNSGVAEVDERRIDPCEGARYRYRFPGRHRYHHLVCNTYRAPSLLGFRGERMWTPLGTQDVAYTFQVLDAGEGSRLRMTVDVRVRGGMLLLVPIITLGWRRDLPEDLEKLRETLVVGEEAEAGPATSLPPARPGLLPDGFRLPDEETYADPRARARPASYPSSPRRMAGRRAA